MDGPPNLRSLRELDGAVSYPVEVETSDDDEWSLLEELLVLRALLFLPSPVLELLLELLEKWWELPELPLPLAWVPLFSDVSGSESYPHSSNGRFPLDCKATR